MEVWAVFFNSKHIQARLTHAGDPTMPQAEPMMLLESRYADAINYLLLGFSMSTRQTKKRHNIWY